MGAALPRAGYGAVQESECRGLLKLLRKRVIALPCRRYACDDPVYQEGERGNALYVLVEGVVKLSEGYSRSRNFVFLVGSWEIFGHLVLAKGPVERAMRRQPEVALKLMTLQEIRLVQYEDLLGCLLPRKREARLANLLMILVQKFGDYPNIGQPTIGLQLTRQDLAEMVASTRESVTKP